MYEAILSDDSKYNIPDDFTSRTSEVLQVYLKSLGVRMETILDEDEYIGEAEHNEVVGFEMGNETIFCTMDEMYYIKKMQKVYKRYLKEHPGDIYEVDDVWDYIMENLPFKKKYLTENIINIFKNHLEVLSQ